MLKRILGFGLGIVGLASVFVMITPRSGAAADQGSEQERRACTPDVFRLCGEFIPDAGRITGCLQRKVNLLSPECRAVFARPTKRGAGTGRT